MERHSGGLAGVSGKVSIMIFPRKKLILPCHKNGYLQSAADARRWRDRFKLNPLAKVADMFIPKPLRMSPGYPCCCEEESEPGEPCIKCNSGTTPSQVIATFSGFSGTKCDCSSLNSDFVLTQEFDCENPTPDNCCYGYFDDSYCGGSLFVQFRFSSLYYTSDLYLRIGIYTSGCNDMDLIFWKRVTYPIDCNVSTSLPNKQEVVDGDCCSYGSVSASVEVS